MTEIKLKGDQFYTIPLDSLDLVYLGKYLHTPKAKKIPLWTKKMLDGESEYCLVEIIRPLNNEECYSEETIEIINCHICNVEVPVTCYKEHAESERHVTLENIFQSIIERLSKQIKATIIHKDSSIDKELLYHCVPCSKIIKIENKQKHEMSPYHIRAKKELSIIKDLYKIFKKENQINSNDFEEVNEKIVDEESESQKNISTEHVQIKTIHNGVSKMQDAHSNDETNTVCSSNDHTTKLTADDNLVSSSFEEFYFKKIIRKFDLDVDLPIIDGDFVHVTNSRGQKVKILKEKFHSFISYGHSYIYCQLCDSYFKPEEKNEHKVTEKHARNIFVQVNEHFARMLCNNFQNHCLICNWVYLTSDLSKHLMIDKYHIESLKSTKISDVQNNANTNPDTVNESEDRRMVELMDENQEQTKSEKRTNEKDLYKPKENKLEYSDDKEYIGGINMSEDRLDDHISDKNHIDNTKEVSPVQKVVLCELCNVTVLQDQIEYHNAGTTHWSNALKKIFTSVALGLQAYLSEDETKSNDTSEQPKDNNKNDNKQDEAKRDENPSKSNIAINNDSLFNN